MRRARAGRERPSIRAGWADTLTLRDIAAELARGLDLLATDLRNVPSRHRSMRAVFAASWHRLGAADQPVFARLAIFRGGGTRRAVQIVTRATLPQLHALVGASLLHYDAGRDRYTVHELLRQYAAERQRHNRRGSGCAPTPGARPVQVQAPVWAVTGGAPRYTVGTSRARFARATI